MLNWPYFPLRTSRRSRSPSRAALTPPPPAAEVKEAAAPDGDTSGDSAPAPAAIFRLQTGSRMWQDHVTMTTSLQSIRGQAGLMGSFSGELCLLYCYGYTNTSDYNHIDLNYTDKYLVNIARLWLMCRTLIFKRNKHDTIDRFVFFPSFMITHIPSRTISCRCHWQWSRLTL